MNNPWGTSTANSLSKLAALSGLPTTHVEWKDTDNAFFVNGERMGQSAGSVQDWIKRHPQYVQHTVPASSPQG